MNFTSKPRFSSTNDLPWQIKGKPLNQDSFWVNLTDIQADSIYGGVSSPEKVASKTTANSPSSFTSKISPTGFPTTQNWSTSLQTILDQPPAALPRQLLLGGMAFTVAFGAWARFGQIEEVGHAQGQLVPQGYVYKIHPTDSGKIVRLGVKEGQTVKAGQLLAELDNQIAIGEVKRLEETLAADQLQLSQKQTLNDRTRLEDRNRVQMANADSQGAADALAEAQAKISDAREQLAQLRADATASSAELARLRPLAATTQELLRQRQADAAASMKRVARLKPLVEQGAISKEQMFEAEQGVRDRSVALTESVLQEDTSVKDKIFEAEQTLRDRQHAITQCRGELWQALIEAKRLQAALNQKQAEGRTVQAQAQERIQQQEVDMSQLKAKIALDKTLLNSAKAKLQQKFLYAPVDGFVSSLNVHNTGEVVQPGQTIAEMAPNNAPLILSTNLPNQEAGFVKTGMSVQIKFDAYPYQEYGVVTGKVVSVSPDAKSDEHLGPVYRVEIALDRNFITANHQTIQFKAGQTATAEIIVRRRHIADILLDPIKQLQKGGMDL